MVKTENENDKFLNSCFFFLIQRHGHRFTNLMTEGKAFFLSMFLLLELPIISLAKPPLGAMH